MLGKPPSQCLKSLTLFLARDFRVQSSENPCGDEHKNHAAKYNNGLPQGGNQGVFVRHDHLPIPELINKVVRLDGDRGATNGVEVRLANVNGGVRDGRLWDAGVELDVPIQNR